MQIAAPTDQDHVCHNVRVIADAEAPFMSCGSKSFCCPAAHHPQTSELRGSTNCVVHLSVTHSLSLLSDRYSHTRADAHGEGHTVIYPPAQARLRRCGRQVSLPTRHAFRYGELWQPRGEPRGAALAKGCGDGRTFGGKSVASMRCLGRRALGCTRFRAKPSWFGDEGVPSARGTWARRSAPRAPRTESSALGASEIGPPRLASPTCLEIGHVRPRFRVADE